MEETRRPAKRRVDWSKAVIGGLVGVLAGVLVFQGMAEARMGTLVKTGEEAPLVAGTTMEGELFDFSKLRGKTVMVDFWETRCDPCREGLPVLISLARQHQGRGVELVMADNFAGEPPGAVEQFVDEVMPIRPDNVHVVLADIESFERYKIQAIPTTYIINRDGKIVERFRGLTPKANLQAALDRAMED